MQDYGFQTIRSVSQPTGSFVAGTVLEHKHLKNQLILKVDIVIGTAQSIEMKLEFSDDEINFMQESVTSVKSGVTDHELNIHRFKDSGSFRVAIPIKDKFIKISIKGNGTLTTTTVGVGSIVGIN